MSYSDGGCEPWAPVPNSLPQGKSRMSPQGKSRKNPHANRLDTYNTTIALCRKRDICYSEKTSTLEFFFTYLEIKIIHEIYITWKMMIWSFSIIFFKFFFSYFIENFEAENNFWSQHCRRLQLIYLFFYSLDYYLSRKIGHRHCCVRKI